MKTKAINSAAKEEPSEYLLEMLRESDADIAAGRVTTFKNPQEALHQIEKLITDDE